MSPPRILFTFGSPDDSGAGRMGFYFARAFIKSGCTVAALLPAPQAVGQVLVRERLEPLGVAIHEVPVMSGKMDASVLRNLTECASKFQAELLVSIHQLDMKYAALAAKRLGIPYVCSGQNTFSFGGNWLRQTFSRLVLGQLLNRSCVEAVATSARVETEFRKFLHFRGLVSQLPNGIDTSLYVNSPDSRAALRAEFQLGNSFAFLTVGRITKQKNHIQLVEAFADELKNRDCRLVIVGDAGEVDADRTYKKQLLQRVAELGLQKHVVFPGWRKDVYRMLSIADCYVHASLWEGSPLAVIEAMAASLPVIVSDCGGVLPTFRNGEHGWVVPVADIRALKSAMLEVLNLQPETRLRIGGQARKLVVSQYDSSIIGGQFVDKSLVHVFARRALSKPGV